MLKLYISTVLPYVYLVSFHTILPSYYTNKKVVRSYHVKNKFVLLIEIFSSLLHILN